MPDARVPVRSADGLSPSGWADLLSGDGQEARWELACDEPYVLLDDARSAGNAFLFHDPLDIVEARTLDAVPCALERVRQASAAGYYAAGFLSYEAGLAFEPGLERLHRDTGQVPLVWFGLFRSPKVVRLPWPAAVPPNASRLTPQVSRARYFESVDTILDLIRGGDCYQVNYTIAARLEGLGSAEQGYLAMRQRQQTGWGGLLSTRETKLLSQSPEMFFSLDAGVLTAKPMKGTAVRGRAQAEDEHFRRALANGPKDRAENLMIVDLMRNDLARVCLPGSVLVERLFAVESYPTVHQMTSTVQGRLRLDLDAIDVIRHLFPCGSITGAPKRRAMEIIRATETHARRAYTGSMGFIAPSGRAAFNVLIRTLEQDCGGADFRFCVGSGIVADSDPESEWRECIAKSRYLKAQWQH